jgi:hypothetical protein
MIHVLTLRRGCRHVSHNMCLIYEIDRTSSWFNSCMNQSWLFDSSVLKQTSTNLQSKQVSLTVDFGWSDSPQRCRSVPLLMKGVELLRVQSSLHPGPKRFWRLWSYLASCQTNIYQQIPPYCCPCFWFPLSKVFWRVLGYDEWSLSMSGTSKVLRHRQGWAPCEVCHR